MTACNIRQLTFAQSIQNLQNTDSKPFQHLRSNLRIQRCQRRNNVTDSQISYCNHIDKAGYQATQSVPVQSIYNYPHIATNELHNQFWIQPRSSTPITDHRFSQTKDHAFQVAIVFVIRPSPGNLGARICMLRPMVSSVFKQETYLETN